MDDKDEAYKGDSSLDRVVKLIERAPYFDNLGFGSLRECKYAVRDLLSEYRGYAKAQDYCFELGNQLRNAIGSEREYIAMDVQQADVNRRRHHESTLDATVELNKLFSMANMAPFMELPEKTEENTAAVSFTGYRGRTYNAPESKWRHDARAAIEEPASVVGYALMKESPSDVVNRARTFQDVVDPSDLPMASKELRRMQFALDDLEFAARDTDPTVDPEPYDTRGMMTSRELIDIESLLSSKYKEARELELG